MSRDLPVVRDEKPEGCFSGWATLKHKQCDFVNPFSTRWGSIPLPHSQFLIWILRVFLMNCYPEC